MKNTEQYYTSRERQFEPDYSITYRYHGPRAGWWDVKSNKTGDTETYPSIEEAVAWAKGHQAASRGVTK